MINRTFDLDFFDDVSVYIFSKYVIVFYFVGFFIGKTHMVNDSFLFKYMQNNFARVNRKQQFSSDLSHLDKS